MVCTRFAHVIVTMYLGPIDSTRHKQLPFWPHSLINIVSKQLIFVRPSQINIHLSLNLESIKKWQYDQCLHAKRAKTNNCICIQILKVTVVLHSCSALYLFDLSLCFKLSSAIRTESIIVLDMCHNFSALSRSLGFLKFTTVKCSIFSSLFLFIIKCFII